jgi:flavin reductase (DIM6/NTAB) family NADH-FMN oxidoreductase RutF
MSGLPAGESIATPDPALRQRFLRGMSHAASTVSVVTTDGIAGRHGVTVSAMVSVSADTPRPILLVCINQSSPVAQAVLDNGVFCVNVLREDQAHISDNFAGRSAARGSDRFDCTRWTVLATGAPRVLDSLVAFDCHVTASERVGTHFVIFGSVEDSVVTGGGAPLIYANRAYGVPQRFHRRLAPQPPEAAGDGQLALGCFQTFAPYVLPALVARLRKLHPSMALMLIEAEQQPLLASLRRGELDLALLYDFGLEADLQVEPLAELVPYVLLPQGHALAESVSISLESLVREPFALLDVEPSRDYFLSLFRNRGLDPLVGYRAASFETVRGLVGHGLAYSLLATKPANSMSYDGRALVTRPLAYPVATSQLVLARLASRPMGAGAQAFAQHCRVLFGAAHAHSHP